MCGIAGQLGRKNLISPPDVLAALQHRGPDAQGIWEGASATCIHTRLAILGLGEAGQQPMETIGEPRAVLVFNGEIYNHQELREALEKEGETFIGDSDTEVLLRLLTLEGEHCLPKLAGMFAFAYVNETSGESLLARDAFGIKPLYYREQNGGVAFASEARVLHRPEDAVDASALQDFFLWGSVPEPATLNSNIRQLPAGHSLRWKDGNLTIQQWWKSASHKKNPPPLASSTNPALLVHDALLESIRRHLVSDVPIGIFLSGGIDSTAILALIREAAGDTADLQTFSIGFEDPAFDESSLARRTAEHFKTRHTEWRMSGQEGTLEIPRFLAAVDQPTIDGFNTWCVCKLAHREGMKVVMSGVGGDEFFAGYPSFKRIPAMQRLHQLLGPLRHLSAEALEFFAPGSPWKRLAEFLKRPNTTLSAFQAQRGIFTAAESAALVRACLKVQPNPVQWNDPEDLPLEPIAAVGWLEITRYMRNQLLRDSDIFSMAHGVELRTPFVDVRLAETLLSIPPHIRLRQGKRLLLEAVPGIPEWVREQPKRGFQFPFQQWMEGSFGEMLSDATRQSPVALHAWYRTWAFASALNSLKKFNSTQTMQGTVP